MDDFKKHKIKEWIKKKKVFFVGTGLFLFCGIVAFFVGMAATGTDIIKMLTQPYAVTIYILIILFLIVCGFIFYVYFINKKR